MSQDVPGLVEMIDLPHADRHVLLDEIGAAMDALKEVTAPYKLNVAALGNSVRQLHVHVIARFHERPSLAVAGVGTRRTRAIQTASRSPNACVTSCGLLSG